MAYEEPDYSVTHQTPNYEIRQYAPYIVAETETEGSFRTAGSRAFRVLAGYIFGNNRSSTKMAMTVPVESQDAAEPVKMAMTAPVISTSDDTDPERYIYRFVMEAKYTMDSLPIPNDSRVKLRQVGPKLMAAKQFTGLRAEDSYEKHKAELLRSLADDGIGLAGQPKLARYNGPFTPWFLRRNEVIVEIDWESP